MADGASLVGSSSLDASGSRLKISTPYTDIVPNRMVFSTANEESRPPQKLTLSNTSATDPLTITGLSFGNSQEQDNAVRLADHQRGADFKLVNTPISFTISAGESREISIQFAPQRVASNSTSPTDTLNGENYASLIITSDDPTQPTKTVDLAGLNFANYEGNNEPSLAEIARTFGWTLNVGSEKQLLGGAKAPFGDEVYSPYWLRADTTKPVYLWPLAVTSSRKEIPHGRVRFEAKPGSGGNSGFLYEFAGRNNDDNIPGSNNLSGGENQKLLPKILVNGVNSVPTTGTVDFNPTKAFALNNGGAWTDDTKNGTGQLHNWRMYPVRDAQGALIPNIWYATHDIGNTEGGFKNYDYNDHVYLLVNAKPESANLNPSAGGLFPGASGLVYNFNRAYTGSLTDKDGQTIGFTRTQLNKNDTFATKPSYNSSLLDIDTSGLGTLKVTTAAGSNGGTNNTLVNGLQTLFDGRAGKSVISTTLVGPLNNLNGGLRQAGVMFGPDQDNYIKLVAIAQNGNPALQFYSEQKGVGTVISTVPLSNPSTLQSLELRLLNDPRTGTVQAAYRLNSSTIQALPGSVVLKGGQLGRYFDTQSKGGITTTHKNSPTPITVAFDQFAITSGETTAARTALYRLDVGTSSGFSYTDTLGNTWSSDTGFFSPSTAIAESGVSSNIANTQDDTLYRTYRGNVGSSTPQASRILSYSLPVRTPDKVDLRLHFAELYWGVPGRGASGPGKRIFDVIAEGVNVLDNFDITAASGDDSTAIVVPIEGVQVNDGVLNLDFKAEVNFPAIAAIEVLRPSGSPA
jgi:hypothetical protein